MVIVSWGYAIYGYVFKGYTWDKAGVIFLMCLIYAIEAYEDVFVGQFRKIGRLNVGEKIFSARWLIILGLFSGLLIVTHNLFYASLFSMMFSLLCCFVLLRISYRRVIVSDGELQSGATAN